MTSNLCVKVNPLIQKRPNSARVDQDAISYISNLQESLSIESYKEFKKSLALYKQVHTQ